tara:strand:- start:67 stop:636 length:570 start_codon:yes stop_codon:yes gene_type:complete
MKKVLFLDGLDKTESTGLKAFYLNQKYDTYTPLLQTSDINILKQKYGDSWNNIDPEEIWSAMDIPAAQVENAIHEFQPDVVVSASFGAALLTRLIEEGAWDGPSVFLGAAGTNAIGYHPPEETKPSIWIHGKQDETVPYAHSVKASKKCGGTLVLVNDDHMLHSVVESGLIDWAIDSVAEAKIEWAEDY